MSGPHEGLTPELESRFEPIVFADPAPRRRGALPLVAALTLGCVALLMLGVQPMVLGALLSEHRLSVHELTAAATVEMLALGIVSGAMAGLLQHRRLRLFGLLAGLLLAAANLGCLASSGWALVGYRGLAGAAGGVLVWVAIGLITRSPAALRLSAIFLGAQSLSQAALAALIPVFAPRLGANAGLIALGALAALSLPLVLAIPGDLPDLPKPPPGGGPLSFAGASGLLSTFLLMGGITGFWVFVDQLGQMDHVAPAVASLSIAASLATQVAGAIFIGAVGPKLPAAPSLVVVSLAFLLSVVLIGLVPNTTVFVAAILLFGFLWTTSLPLFFPLLVAVDPTRRAAMLLSGAQLLGGSAGPIVTGLFATETNVRPVPVVSAGLFLATIVAVGLSRAARRPAPLAIGETAA